jgi:hypothetical protein
MKAGRAADEKNAISRAIHEASVKAGYPDDDMFQRFFCLEQADLKVDLNYPGLPKPRCATATETQYWRCSRRNRRFT